MYKSATIAYIECIIIFAKEFELSGEVADGASHKAKQNGSS